ncbi:MAG: HAMP domain-containing histidine kinase [Lachnospiraceae bacterium]|nr:HAMP domain-containing histidine kinase [Lachnospiraceae bacterium]
MKTKTKNFKTKLWTYFALFTAFIFIVLWLLQTVFLQGFYNRMLISDTREAAEDIIANSTKPDIEKKIDTIARKNSILVVVADENGDMIYSSDEFKSKHTKSRSGDDKIETSENLQTDTSSEQPAKKPSKPNTKNSDKNDYRSLPDDFDDVLKMLEESSGEYVERTNDDYYVYGTYINFHGEEGQSILYISTPMNAVGASVSILQKILALVTVLSLAAGFVLSWFLAKKFSKPVDTLCRKAEKLGEKDYSPEYEKGFCSELDALNDTLDQTNDKLNISRDFQMQLLSNVSHDLRTPLTMIKGYAEMIRDISWEDSEAMKDDIQVVIKEADRLNALVNEILEYSELQSDTMHRDFEEFDLSELVKSTAERFEKLSSPDNVIIEKDIESGIISSGDQNLIERALYNLMDNAVRHTGDGKNIRVSLKKADGKAIIEVRDYGAGIPAEEIEHIWERYYTSRQRKGKGVSGLGLAIVRQIVGMHNGKCYARSSQGEGCTFYIELKS